MTTAPATSPPATPPAATRTPPSRWANWNPLWLCFGPTFQKEMRVSGRKDGTYVFRGLYIFGVLALTVLMYIAMRSGMAMGTGTAQMAQLQSFAPGIATMVLWFQYAVLTFRAPVLTSGAICDEKRTRTLPALMTSPLVSGEIILGKLTSRLVQLLILALTVAPLLLAIRVFGGVPTTVVLAGLGVGLASAILAASLALLLSVTTTKPSSAASVALGIMIVLAIGPVLVFTLLSQFVSGLSFDWLTVLSSPVTMGRLTMDMQGVGSAMPGGSWAVPYWALNIAYQLALAALATGLAIVMLRGVLRREAVSATVIKSTRAQRRRARKATSLLGRHAAHQQAQADPEVDDQPVAFTEPAEGVVEVSRPSRIVGDRPVLWRELHQKTFKTRTRLVITLAVLAALLGFLYWKVGVKNEALNFLIVIGSMLGIVANAAAQATGSITAEREGQTWETLLTTPVSSRSILYAKLLGAVRQVWFIPMILLAHLVLVGIPFGQISPIILVHLVPIVITTIVFLCSTGLFFSLVMRKSATASSANIGLAVLLWLGLPMALGIARGLLDTAQDLIESLISAAIAINPPAMAGAALAGALDSSNYSIGPTEVSRIGFTAVVVGVCVLGLVVSAGVMELAVRLFPRLGGRTS